MDDKNPVIAPTAADDRLTRFRGRFCPPGQPETTAAIETARERLEPASDWLSARCMRWSWSYEEGPREGVLPAGPLTSPPAFRGRTKWHPARTS